MKRLLKEPAAFEFLRIEISTGLTFADIAAGADDAQKRERTRDSAQDAYDTVVRFMPRSRLDADQTEEITTGLARLKAALDRI